jgi:transcriptional regulator with XRE-family HTH domain
MTSASPRVDKRRRTYSRLLGEIHHALNAALNEEKVKRGLNMTKIGKLLGLGRSAISKKFDGRHNMTLETLADLAFALDRPVKIFLPERSSIELTNHLSSEFATEGIKLASIATAFALQTSRDEIPADERRSYNEQDRIGAGR